MQNSFILSLMMIISHVSERNSGDVCWQIVPLADLCRKIIEL